MDDQVDVDDMLSELVQLAEDTEGDRDRLRSLLRGGHLEKPQQLASQMVQTVHAGQAEFTRLVSALLPEHQEGIVQLEDAAYNSVPKAFALLTTALVAHGSLSNESRDEILKLVGTPQTGESYLNQEDGAMVLDLLIAFRATVEAEAGGVRTTPLNKIEQAIERVRQITDLGDGASGDDDEDDGSDTADTVAAPAPEPEPAEAPAE